VLDGSRLTSADDDEEAKLNCADLTSAADAASERLARTITKLEERTAAVAAAEQHHLVCAQQQAAKVVPP
jgi:ribosome-associated translation inhibitor RaiA